jgi:mono/diheme cytochrome c family protein
MPLPSSSPVPVVPRLGVAFWLAAMAVAVASPALGQSPTTAAMAQYRSGIEPVLKEYCYDCHGDGMDKGRVTLDQFASEEALLGNHELWLHVLKNVRAGLMPPAKKKQPTAEQKQQLEAWIKQAVFRVDPKDLDPGRVTVRRLNRVEYRNTIRDLMGIEFDTQAEFPADDTGHGFDNIGDVLTVSPMLLEKYLAAARTIVTRAVPAVSHVPVEVEIPGRKFAREGLAANGDALVLSYYETNRVSHRLPVSKPGRYQLQVQVTATEKYVDNQFDYNKARLGFQVDGEALVSQELTRENGRALRYEFDRTWTAGDHELAFSVDPLTPDEKRVRTLAFRIDSVTVRGPMDGKHFVRPKNYAKFFPKDPPKDRKGRRQYACELLGPFVERAYRRPVESETLDRLVAVAEQTYSQKGASFESGISQAMVAVLASPRFLFREEGVDPTAASGSGHPFVDEHALASRLSYFLWSTMPDAELFRLAGEGKLRTNLAAQVDRMMRDTRFEGFIRNFVGQWLQARDVETTQIDSRQVLMREAKPDPDFEAKRARFTELRRKPESEVTAEEKKWMDEMRPLFQRRNSQPLRAELNGELRRAMRMETEKTFAYVVRENRSFRELLDGNYTFLNERLAKHYDLGDLGVKGDELRRVELPADSPRGGLLTQGTVLVVTSNPTRTSPVKRGLFILENILGTPPPPAPPDVPPLEDAAKAMKEKTLTLRETLELHRQQPLCSGCHNRMDPLGLALENFNAMGMWRSEERALPIDASATLLTGESFGRIQDLKRILGESHSEAFYHTLTEKVLTYALGRGLEYHDVETVDAIVARLTQSGGKPAELFTAVIGSAPFQKTRRSGSGNALPKETSAPKGGSTPSQP